MCPLALVLGLVVVVVVFVVTVIDVAVLWCWFMLMMVCLMLFGHVPSCILVLMGDSFSVFLMCVHLMFLLVFLLIDVVGIGGDVNDNVIVVLVNVDRMFLLLVLIIIVGSTLVFL